MSSRSSMFRGVCYGWLLFFTDLVSKDTCSPGFPGFPPASLLLLPSFNVEAFWSSISPCVHLSLISLPNTRHFCPAAYLTHLLVNIQQGCVQNKNSSPPCPSLSIASERSQLHPFRCPAQILEVTSIPLLLHTSSNLSRNAVGSTSKKMS